MPPRPLPGETVRYTLPSGLTRPAIVTERRWTEQEGATVDLQVLGDPSIVPDQYPRRVPYRSRYREGVPGTWSY
jgi:hypothetical protein